MATELTKVTFPTGDYIDISGKVSKSGDTMTGMLTVPKTKIANTCYGVSFGRTTATPVETILKTGIKWVSGSHMPVIHITGYAYGLTSPVEFKIGFYIYNGQIGWSGACNMGAWEPELRLFKYTRDSVDYVAVGFVGSCYFLQLQADVQDEMSKLAYVVLDDANWSWEFYTDTGHIPTPDGGTTCIGVPYKANILNGIRNVSINGNYLRVNNNGTNTDLTIPYATSANQLAKSSTLDTVDKLNAFMGSGLKYASINGGIVTSSTDGLVLTIPWNTKYGQQIYFDDNSYIIKHRYCNNGTWSDWKGLIDESNINDYAPTKTGTGASGTWGISISGNAATATSADTASKLGSSNVGSATQPIYLNGGTATACTYTLGKSVPSDAVFTDTNTNVTQTATSTNADYEVLFSGTADNTTRTEGARKDSNLLYNPSSNTLGLKNTGISNSITPSSISLSNSSGGGISIDNTNNKIEVGKSGTSITYSNTDIVTSNGNTWDGTNTSLKSALTAAVGTDEKVTQTESTTDAEYEVIFAGSTGTTTTTEGVGKSWRFRYNPGKQAFSLGSRQANSTVGNYSIAMGSNVTASGDDSHAEGGATKATGACSHAEGEFTTASGEDSHAEGSRTIANHLAQHAFGQYNIEDPSTAAAYTRGNYIEIVGNGTSNAARSNARTLDWDGNEWLAGSLTIPYNETSSGYTYTASIGQGKVRVENNSAFPIYTEMEYDGIKLSDNGHSSRSDNIISPSDITISTTWDGTNTSLKTAFTHTPYVVPCPETEGYPMILGPNNDTEWICFGGTDGGRGIIPSKKGTKGSGHCNIGTNAWYWANSFIDNMYCTNLGSSGVRVSLAYIDTITCYTDLYLRASTSTNDCPDIVWYYYNGKEKSRIWTDNTYSSALGPNYRVYNSSGTNLYSGRLQQTSSSIKIKKNIENITQEDANKIFDLRPVVFDYKNDDSENQAHAGFIAEEVLEIFPKIVTPESGNEGDDKWIPMCLRYEEFIPYMVKVIQKQQQEIDELKQNIMLLKNN
jgi:hypothetical protein